MTQMAGDKLFELFDIALDTSSPYTIPSRGDLEKDDIFNSPGYKHLLEKGLIPPPVKKADSSWLPDNSPLLAHVNADGTAHDWQESGHRNIKIGDLGEVDPHGRRGGLTWGDGRAKYSQEDVIRKIKDGLMYGDILQNDDRFWAPNTKPGDGSYMTPEAQELIKQIWNEKDAL